VIPKVHIATLNDFAAEQSALIGELLLVARRLAADHGLPGYRVAMNVNREGGQVIFHAHLHVLGGRPLKGALG
jgi:histidine triad (HIT) family protein